jgi:hypothetical protein
MHRKLIPATLAAVLALAACDGSSTGPAKANDSLTAAEVQALAPAFDNVTLSAFGGTGASLNRVPRSGAAWATTVATTVNTTVTCPKGGSVNVAGQANTSFDLAARSATVDATATRTEAACAYATKDASVITVSGAPNTALHLSASVANGVPGKATVTQKGAFTWARSTGGSGTCALDLTSSFDPATQTATLAGTFCGVSINVTHTVTTT